MRNKALFGVLFLVLFTGFGCLTNFRDESLKEYSKKGYTEEEQLAALHYSYRKFLKEPVEDIFVVNYAVLPNEEVTKIVEQRLSDLGQVLDYKNPQWAPYLRAFPDLHEKLERQERLFKGRHARLQLVDLFNKFQEFTGEQGSYHLKRDRGYDASKIFTPNLIAAFPFVNDRIEEAKKRGVLEEVEHFIWFLDRNFDSKELDPNDPNDENKFIWKSKVVGLEVSGYKIISENTEKPKDNKLDYMEAKRVWKDAGSDSFEQEKEPALRVFVMSGATILIIDKEREGEIGFGLPDFVERAYGLSHVEDVVSRSILDKVFYEAQDKKRIPPRPEPPIVVEIARVGDIEIDVWEENTDGWEVPFRYKNRLADNFSAGFKFKNSEKDDFDSNSYEKQIEYFKKEWSHTGSVEERFEPKKPFDKANLIQVTVYGKEVTIVTDDGGKIFGLITSGKNRFIKDRPFAILFTEGDIRWLIVDENGDGKYEKRRQISIRNN